MEPLALNVDFGSQLVMTDCGLMPLLEAGANGNSKRDGRVATKIEFVPAVFAFVTALGGLSQVASRTAWLRTHVEEAGRLLRECPLIHTPYDT